MAHDSALPEAIPFRTLGSVSGAVKAVLAVLVVIGFWHRQRTVGPAAAGRLLPLLQLAAGELLIMGATIGIAVVLSTTA